VSIGRRIRAVRKRAGLSQAEFARRLSIARRTLITWEHDKVEVPASAIAFLRTEFDVSPQWLLLGEDEVPRRAADPIDWEAFAAVRTEVKKLALQAGIKLTPPQLERLAQSVFEAGVEVFENEKKQLLRNLISLARER